jgi:hypothetical protein
LACLHEQTKDVEPIILCESGQDRDNIRLFHNSTNIQVFETSAEFVARAEWNALVPRQVRSADMAGQQIKCLRSRRRRHEGLLPRPTAASPLPEHFARYRDRHRGASIVVSGFRSDGIIPKSACMPEIDAGIITSAAPS